MTEFDRDMNAFLRACDLAGPLQFAVRGPGPNDSGVKHLHQPFALVGRDERADVPFDHKLVSRRHLYLQAVEGRAFWLDLDSRSGTCADGQVRKFGWLEHGRSIRIGPFELTRLSDGTSAPKVREPRLEMQISPLAARSYNNRSLPEVSLEFLNGPSRSACWPMNRVMSLIGSASGCKFRLADPSVSAFHCSLLRTPLGLWVVDLLGPDGISINDISVRYALLAPDDVLSVGRYRIRIRIRFTSPELATADSDRGVPAALAESRKLAHVPLTAVFSNGKASALPVLASRSWREPGGEIAAINADGEQLTGNEHVSPEVNVVARLEKSEITETLLVPLLNQFGQMQQQMLDQFQQAISMIVQTFGAMHHDQMTTIREELDQLREVTREFQAIKLELAARSQDSMSRVPADRLPASGESQVSAMASRSVERDSLGTGSNLRTEPPGIASSRSSADPVAPGTEPHRPIPSMDIGLPAATFSKAAKYR